MLNFLWVQWNIHKVSTKKIRPKEPLPNSPKVSLLSRSSSRGVGIRVPLFSVVYSIRGTIPLQKGKRALLGDLVKSFRGTFETSLPDLGFGEVPSLKGT